MNRCLGMLGLCCLLLMQSCGEERDTLFRLVPPDESGIHFSNRIIESDSINVLENEYVYNGGGVALADFNQDGLLDVYMSGNMVENALYLNKGNFEFENITEQAGVGNGSRWSSGVTLVDVNQDGWTDIHVAATNRPTISQRKNTLFIHQGLNEAGVPTFKDMAAEYGLADTSHTTHAAFFDYDNDGDLDVFLAVDAMIANKQPNKYKEKNLNGSTNRYDRLYRNDLSDSLGHPFFTEVSQEAGILIEGYSLGLNITDINRDGWKDIFVTNDYVSNDLMYINNGDGTFTDKASDYFKHTSHSAMGNDVIDINSDGRVDIVCLDMLPEDNYRRKTMLGANNYTTYLNNKRYGYDFQYVRNTFQLNQGILPESSDPIFSDVAMYAGISATDWSWTPLVADFDNDGYRDMIITNGFPKDVTDRDFIDYWSSVEAYAPQSLLLSKIPSVKISNYAYRNEGGIEFEDATDDWGIRMASFSNGAAYGDLDNDGDLDYIVNNIDDSAFVFQNRLNDREGLKNHWLRVGFEGSENNKEGTGVILEIQHGDIKQHWEHNVSRGYISSVEPFAHFGLGTDEKVDKLSVIWPDGKVEIKEGIAADQTLVLNYEDAEILPEIENLDEASTLFSDITEDIGLDFIHSESDYIDFNVQPMLPHKLTQYGPALAVSDVNGDGLQDVYIGGSHFNKGRFAIQQEDGSFLMEDLLPGPDGDKKRQEELGALFFDADKDGDDDLYLVSGGYEFKGEDPSYQDRFFRNDGGKFTLLKEALPAFLSSGSAVKAADYDGDGDFDLFVGGRVHPFHYPIPVSSYLLKNDSEDGNIKFSIDEKAAPMLKDIGLVCDALWTDFDNNGTFDLLLAGEWMPLTFLKNEGGNFTNITEAAGFGGKKGWWNSLAAGDFDRDGDIDYIAANQGNNTLFKTNSNYPIKAYGADFDGNKGFDFVQASWFPKDGNDKELVEVPYFSRIDFQKQMIKVRQDFPYHAEFGYARMSDILPAANTAKDYVEVEANYLKTSFIENLGNGKFDIRPLPMETQLAPVYAMLIEDFDGDALLDVLMAGNDFGTEVAMGRSDAFNGLMLKGDGKGGFRALEISESGFYLPGDAKALVRFRDGEGNTRIMASQNSDKLKVFAQRVAVDYVELTPFEFSGYFHFPDGTKQVWELGYGTSFLSQSSRAIQVPEGVKSVEIHDTEGNIRRVE
ncbi:MAG: VCBS repeat-containing protein [Bacteroidia bacterium]|nr:VCBS repeat-containing protein [Bacteroidia bacterium]